MNHCPVARELTINERQIDSNLLSAEALIEVSLSANEPQTLRDKFSWATKILDADFE
jgi:hypothetical protein